MVAKNYVSKRMLIALNQAVVEMSGGSWTAPNNLRAGLGLGFVDQIYANEVFGQVLYPDVFHQAAAYMFYVVKNHLFLDGNKRTGLLAAVIFLQWNQIPFAPIDQDAIYDVVVDIAGGDNVSEVVPKIAAWLKGLCLPE